MGLKDNRQRLLVIGNEKDIKRFIENDSDITKLNQYYSSNEYSRGSDDWVIDITPNSVDINYNYCGEGMDSESFRITHYYLEEVITRYPNLNFVWTTIYEREVLKTYLIKHKVRDIAYVDKTIKDDYKKNIKSIVKLFEYPNLDENGLDVMIKPILLTDTIEW